MSDRSASEPALKRSARDRADRLAAALRANLARRKAQRRARDDAARREDAAGASDSE